mgnify:FL=1
MKKTTFALKGSIVYSMDKDHLGSNPNSYLICENGICAGVFECLPERYQNIPVKDYGNQLIIPGLVDLHLHAPQYGFRGLGMDLELLDWLNTNTFPEEAKYADLSYAEKGYRIFAEELANSATTRAVIFATIHVPATKLLMDLMEKTGMKTYVGKLNMDRNSPDYLCESDAQQSLDDTEKWIQDCKGRYQNTAPILTPRFTPSCTDQLMESLGKLQKRTGLPVQSHLSENKSEIKWVQELCPDTRFYGESYDRYGMFGGQDCKTIMAHCVYSSPEEVDLMEQRGVYIAHCPQSNTNLSSGVAPVRAYLDRNLRVGLGSDIAGGFSPSIFRAMSDAVQVSKLRWRLLDDSLKPLTMPEAIYLGTKGGGTFFGKVGSFEEGYEFDAVVLDDSSLRTPMELTPIQRLERVIYLSDDRVAAAKYVAGQLVKEP